VHHQGDSPEGLQLTKKHERESRKPAHPVNFPGAGDGVRARSLLITRSDPNAFPPSIARFLSVWAEWLYSVGLQTRHDGISDIRLMS